MRGSNRGSNTESVVLSMREFHDTLNLASDRGTSAVNNKKVRLHQRSQARYKNWGNTLEALREKKKQDRLRRMEEIERVQQIIDEKEASYQEAQRRAAIDRANRMLYAENDRVKTFHSGLLMATVLKEREAQIRIKKAKESQRKQIDHMYHRMYTENGEKLLAKEQKEEKIRKQKSMMLAKKQLKQLEEYRERRKQERAEEVKEGERNKKISMDAMREARDQERRRHERMKENNRLFLLSNLEQQRLKAEQRRLEQLEEEKLEAFAKEKERVAELRREQEEERIRKKQARFEKMLKCQYDHLKSIKDQEEQRVERQVMEQKEKDDKNHAEKIRRAKELEEQIRKSRLSQLRRRATDREQQRKEDKMMAAEWQRRNKELEQMEVAKKKKTFEKSVQLQSFWQNQIDGKSQKAQRERSSNLELAKQTLLTRDIEDDIFHHYAGEHMRDFKERGKNAMPMKLILDQQQLFKKRVSYQPSG